MDLIWIIYIMDFLGSGEPFIGWRGLAFLGMVILTYLVFGTMTKDLNSNESTEDCFKAVWGSVAKIKVQIICWVLFCSFGIIANAVIPSKDTAYKMLAAYGLTEIARTDEAQRLAGKSLQILEKAMDDYLKESEGI